MTTLLFQTDGAEPIRISLASLTIAGWTGRDAAAVAHHIEELAAIGVPRPSETPLYYRVAPDAATQVETIVVLGDDTGGEAEPVLLNDGATLWLALGSDHTDRGLEAASVAHSKAVCPKPMSSAVWPFASVRDRLDALELRSEISGDGETWVDYQVGTLAQIRPLTELLAGAPERGAGSALFCGTLPAIGGVRATPWFRATLTDPATGRSLEVSYKVDTLPVVA